MPEIPDDRDDGGLVVREVDGDVATVVARITAGLQRRGVRLFATIDHAAAAREAGLELPPEVALVFGDPAVGTGLMQADPAVGLDLPLRIVVWAATDGARLAYRHPQSLTADFAISTQAATLTRLAGLLEQLAAEAGGTPG